MCSTFSFIRKEEECALPILPVHHTYAYTHTYTNTCSSAPRTKTKIFAEQRKFLEHFGFLYIQKRLCKFHGFWFICCTSDEGTAMLRYMFVCECVHHIAFGMRINEILAKSNNTKATKIRHCETKTAPALQLTSEQTKAKLRLIQTRPRIRSKWNCWVHSHRIQYV